MYFTRWIEMVHPVPGGPTFPELKKRGHKKNIDIVVGDIAAKADQSLQDLNMGIDGGDILEFEKSKDKVKEKGKDKNGVSYGSTQRDGQRSKSLGDIKEMGEEKKRR